MMLQENYVGWECDARFERGAGGRGGRGLERSMRNDSVDETKPKAKSIIFCYIYKLTII
jgi:hypothetical protein